MPMSKHMKFALFGTTVGIAFIAFLAGYLRRRKRRPYRDIRIEKDELDGSFYSQASSEKNSHHSHRYKNNVLHASNGDVRSKRSVSPNSLKYLKSQNMSNSTSSLNSDVGSNATLTPTLLPSDTSHLGAPELCDLGLDAVQVAIQHWEDAVEKLAVLDQADMDDSNDTLEQQLRQLIERAYRLRESFELNMYIRVSDHAAIDSAMSAIQEMDQAYSDAKKRRPNVSFDESSTDQESFVSALDMADLSDIDDHKDAFQHLVLYEAALLELEHGSIPCRTLRTKLLHCGSDTEFLAKLHCVRLALQNLFSDESVKEWFTVSGKQLIADILTKADRDPEEFAASYEELISFVRDKNNLSSMEEELKGRGVRMMTFYDVVIDFILLDAFDDLENPPSSVTTVVQNRWLSNGFKETALGTAVWSVLKAKRRLLKFPDGFIAHFYAISEHVSPVLAWGFLGPEGPLKDLCKYFKNQVLDFMREIFSFDKVHYGSVEKLAEDIHKLSKQRFSMISNKLSS